MILAVDQYGNKSLLKDKKHKTIRSEFNVYGGRIQPMYIDTKNGPKKIGYVVGQGVGNYSLWLELFNVEPI